MKNKLWLVFGILCSTSLLAEQASNAAPASGSTASPAAATPAAAAGTPPATAPGNPAAKVRREAELRTVALKPGPATVVANHVNVRGQPRLKGEILTRLSRGQQVTVVEEITLDNSAPDEPSAWAKILLPPGARTWVNTNYIDPATKTVTATRLNLRGGPGENYSVIGRIERGTTVKELSTKGDWIEIEPPGEAYAFLAAQYLSQESEGSMAAVTQDQSTTPSRTPEAPAETVKESAPEVADVRTTPPATVTNEPAPPVTPVPEAPDVAETPIDAASTNETASVGAASTNATDTAAWRVTPSTLQTDTNQPAISAEEETPETEEPPPPRIVQREGVVRGSGSIQAPTRFELFSPDSGKIINYLYTTARDLDLSRYKGLRIIVTGEEGLDQRWHNTPVLTIQRIQVLE